MNLSEVEVESAQLTSFLLQWTVVNVILRFFDCAKLHQRSQESTLASEFLSLFYSEYDTVKMD